LASPRGQRHRPSCRGERGLVFFVGGSRPPFRGFSGLIIPLRHSIGFAGSAEGGGPPPNRACHSKEGGPKPSCQPGSPLATSELPPWHPRD
jgi:hypothetical protein